MGTKVFSALALLGAFALSQACSSGDKGSGFADGDKGGTFKGGEGDSGALGGDGGAGGLLEAGCATATADTQRAPVYMLIVLDGSGSMGEQSKWVAATGALDAIFDDLQTKNDNTLGVGLLVFADNDDGSCNPFIGRCTGPYPGRADVTIGPVDQAQHDALRGRIDRTGPLGDTPTHAALSGGYRALEAFQASGALAPNGKKVLVLMSDGEPTDSTKSDDTQIVGSELSKQIQTFAVGIGPFPSNDLSVQRGYDPTFMGAIAKSGGTAPASCNPNENRNLASVCHFQVTPGGSVSQLTQQFVDAINKIRGAAASCEYTLSKSGGTADPSQVNVVYTDQGGQDHVLVQDDQNGWSYDDPTNPSKVILHGSDCDQVKNDPSGKISIVLGCKTVTK
jgi:von Willebrand factor type A domain